MTIQKEGNVGRRAGTNTWIPCLGLVARPLQLKVTLGIKGEVPGVQWEITDCSGPKLVSEENFVSRSFDGAFVKEGEGGAGHP